MKIQYLIFPLILILASCANNPPPATGGIDPNMAQIIAQATVDAAATNVSSTAVAANATQSAIFAHSTAQAQSTAIQSTAIAQATQAQGTAVAAATGTEKAQLDSAAAIGQMTRDAIAADALKVEMAATATAIQARANADAARAARAASTAVFWQWFRWVLLGAFGLGAFVFIPILGRLVYYRNLPTAPAYYDEDGNLRIYRRDYHALPSVTITQPREPREAPQPIYAQRDKGYSRETTLPAPSTTERQNINAWLVSVNEGLCAFNRTGADTYRIGHARADALIDLAVRMGYASKEGGQTSPVIPCDNFEGFINQIIGNSPHSNMVAPQTASPGPSQANGPSQVNGVGELV